MSYAERVANLGYLGIAPQSSPTTPVAATDFVPFYDEGLTTNRNLQDQAPIFGNKFETFNVLAGQRDHGGDITVLAEPNTVLKFFDMLLTRGTAQTIYTFTVTSANATVGATYTNNAQTFTVLATIAASTTLICAGTGAPLSSGTLTKATGTGDATIAFSANVSTTNRYWPMSLSSSGETYYTFDISTGNGLLTRYYGVQASKIVPTWNNNEMQLKISTSALGSFQGREISSVSGGGPYTVVLKTDYDASPTTGLIVGDLIRFALANGTTVDATVATITNGTTFTTATNPTVSAGDFIYLRPQTVSLNNLPTFLWSNTQFCFGATALTALAAAQLQVEAGSSWEMNHNFHNDKGEHRSGSQDPVSLVRTTGNAALSIKKFFRDDQDIKYYNNLAKQALVIRHFAVSGGFNYELRLTFNNIITDDPAPQQKAKELGYSTIKYHPMYDSADSAGMSVVVIDALTSIT